MAARAGRRRARALGWAWAVGLLLSAPAAAHEFHASLAEARYNPATHSLEVSLRVFTDDLERALTHAYPTQGPFRLAEADVYLAAYLQKHFQVFAAGDTTVPLHYVGQEVAVDVTWLYFEFPCGAQPPTQLSNSVLVDLFSDQKNLVNVTSQATTRSYVLTRDETTAPLL